MADIGLATADICDRNPAGLQVLEPVLRFFTPTTRFFGPVATLRVFEDNALVRELVQSPGQGRVLVIDGGGSLRCALVGGNLARLAYEQGWAGLVVMGAVRDVLELTQVSIGIMALAPCPRKAGKTGSGVVGGPVFLAGTPIHPGQYLYADPDGVVIVPEPVSLD